MRDFIATYRQFLLILLVWTVAPFLIGSLPTMVLAGLSLVFMILKGALIEIFFGFIFILVLSDSLLEQLEYAKLFKNVYILLLLAVLVLNSDKTKLSGQLLNSFLPFFAIAFFALQFAGNLNIGIQKTTSYLLLLLIVPSFMLYFINEHGKEVLKHLAYFLVFIILIGFVLTVVNFNYGTIEGGRLRGLFGNPNGLGIFTFLTFVFFYVLSEFSPNLFSSSERRFFFFIIFLTLIFTGSRSAIVSCLMVIIFTRLQRNSPLLTLTLFVTIIISYQAITLNLIEIVKYFGLEQSMRVSTLEEGSGRFIAWQFAWFKIQNFYYFGGGFGNDEFIMRQNYRELALLGHQGGVHNSYLTFWFDSGIIGLSLYFFGFIRSFILNAAKRIYSIPCLYAVLFSITYESWLAGSLNPFTIILLLSITLFYYADFKLEEGLPETTEMETKIIKQVP